MTMPPLAVSRLAHFWRMPVYAMLAVFGVFTTVNAADDYTAWSYSTTINVNTTVFGANVGGNVIKFPVLVRLNPGNFTAFAQTLAGGADIRFSKTDGTHIPYQIERWVDNTGNIDTAAIWVKLDTVYGNSSTHSFIMYWGKSGAIDSSSGSSVFETTNGFVAVYHLNSASGNTNDATVNALTGSALNSPTYSQAGQIGFANGFNGGTAYFGCGTNSKFQMDGSDKVTVSAWVNRSGAATAGDEDGIAGKWAYNAGNYREYCLINKNTTNHFQFHVSSDGTNETALAATTTTSNGTWYYVTGMMDASNMYIFVNGAQENSAAKTAIYGSTNANFRIGLMDDNGSTIRQFWNGKIDEVRVENTNRSANWIKLCYQNQQANQTLISWTNSSDMTWDNSASSGIQTGGGTWGSNNYWTLTAGAGTSLSAWPGAGTSANFAGADGHYTITISTSQYADSLTFANDGYVLSGGTNLILANKLIGAVFGFSPPYATGYDSANAFDGNTSTYCDDAATGNGVTGIDLGSGNTAMVSRIRYWPRTSWESRMTGGIFAGSNDGTNYTTLYTVPSTPTSGAWTTANITNRTAWRYLRYQGPANSYTNVSEIEFYGSAGIYVASGKYDTISTVIDSTSGIFKYGAGYLTLSANNVFNGVVGIYDGKIQAVYLANGGSNSGIGSASNAASNLILNGGILRYIGGTVSCDHLFTLGTGTATGMYASGSGALTMSNTGSIAFSGSGARSFELGGAYTGANNIFAPILGDGTGGATSLTKTGACTWVLTGANTYTGNTIIATSGGTLQIGNSGTTGSIAGNIYDTSALVFARSNSYTFSGVIAGTGTVTQNGAGTLTLSGANSYSGVTTISAGTLSVSSLANGGSNCNIGSAANSASNLVINSGTLTYTGGAVSCNRLFTVGTSGATIDASGTGALTLSNAGSIVYSGSTTHLVTLSGSYAGSGNTFTPIIGNDGASAVSVTKSGTGIWILPAVNTYTGATTVSVGTLWVTGSTASGSSVSVSSGATLGGTGTIGGAVSVSGTLSPGTTGIGMITVNGNLTFAGGSTYNVLASGTTAGTGYDQTVAGAGTTVTLGSANLSFAFGYTPTVGHSYTIIDNQGSNPISGTFSGLSEGASSLVSYAGTIYNCTITYVGGTGSNDVVVTVASVAGAATDDYTQWHYSKNIYIDTKEGGANIAADQLKFPLLVRLTSSNFDFSQAMTTGADVRFSKSNGDHLQYQIERWDNANSLAELWVRIDTVRGFNNTQYFTMYWGKNSAVDSSSGGAVFDTAKGFRGVWHLNTSGAGPRPDATLMNGSAKSKGAAFTSGGAIAGCDTFVPASSQYDSVASGINLSGKSFTVMAWFKLDNSIPTSFYGILGEGPATNDKGLHFGYKSTALKCTFAFYGDDLNQLNNYSGGTNWHLLAGTYNKTGRAQILYMDGVQDNSRTASADFTGNGVFRIGTIYDYDMSTGYFGGKIDEVVVADSVRSADWIKLCYETQRPNNSTVLLYEDYSTWLNSKRLYFNTRASGANVSNSVVKFPVLLRLDTTNFDFTTARDSGQDIRFTKSDGTHLYYEIENWDNVNENATIWVRADTIYGNDSVHFASMYWGNSSVMSRSNGKGVFDTSNGFSGVWHLNESPGGGSGCIKDHTVNAHDGTPNGTIGVSNMYSTTGVIGPAINFDGTTNYINLATPTTLVFGNANLTVSAWIYTASTSAQGIVMRNNNGTHESGDKSLGVSNVNDTKFGVDNGWVGNKEATSNVTNGNWHHVVWTQQKDYSSTNEGWWLYVDGTQENTATYGTYADISTHTVQIGQLLTGSSPWYPNRFSGKIDEVIISNVTRSADWVKLCYQNQKAGQSLVSYTYEDYTQWSYSRKVNINTSQSGSNSAALAQNFPTLIRLTSATFPFGQAQDDGSDIRFAKLDGTKLSYEIERWDRSNQLAEIWVLLDSVKANSGTQFIRMYWGKSGVTSRSNGNAVFTTANGFVGVWHLKESSGNTADATANALSGTTHSGVNYSKSGMAGLGDSLDGTNNGYFDMGTDAAFNMNTNKKVTVSAWVNHGNVAMGGNDGIVGRWNWPSGSYREFDLYGASGTPKFMISTDGLDGTRTIVSATSAMTNGTWYYLTGMMDASNMYIFVNGVSNASAAKADILYASAGNTIIGCMGVNSSQNWNGNIDEVRIENTNRSADWIKVCYENQKTNQTLVDLDDYDQWAYSKKIYINTSSMGLGGNVIKFPLLMRIDTALIGGFNLAQGQGQDLRFSKADGTHLNYEIEKWDSAGKAASAWVLVDTIFQSSATQYIKMYWGKSDAVAKTNSNAVFDTANNFAGVWHFHNNTFTDATIGSHNASNGGTVDTTGISGGARKFNQVNPDSIVVTNPDTLGRPSTLTLSCWVKVDSIDAANSVTDVFTISDCAVIRAARTGTGNDSLQGLFHYASGYRTILTPFASGKLLKQGWKYVTFVCNPSSSSQLLYVNGAAVGSGGTYSDAVAYTTGSGKTKFGKNGLNNSNDLGGVLDEVRVEKTARNADWIKLCYNTQIPSATVVGVDSTTERFLPMTVSTFGASQGDSLDSCIIATKKWTLKFDRFTAGGIKWLSPDSMGTTTNQLDTNLFYLITNNNRSDTGLGMLKLQDKGKVFTTLDQRKIVGGQLYIITYTVLGSGKVYIRVSTRAFSNLSPTGGLEFRIAANTTANITNAASSATASNCKFLLHSDAGTNRIDPCLELYENWSQADGLTGNASTKYYGIQSSTWKLPANRSQAWEFMIDFSHCNWNDTSGVVSRVNSYRTPDSLVFYQGTPLLEKSWERQLSGHWKFEEGSGDTTFDNSANNNYGIRPSGATWTWNNGKWGRCLSLAGGNDKVFVADNPAFDHLVQNGFTICAWLKPSSTMSSTNGIFKKFGTGGYAFSGGSGGVVQLTLNSSSLPSRTSIGSQAWHHVAAVYRRNYTPFDTVKLYIDGKPDTVFSGVTYEWDTSNADVHIGSGFNGDIDDVRFYGNDLTDEEIKAIYQLGFAANQGMYMLRADNNNTVHLAIDGYANHRYFPTFQIKNYWSGNQPSSTTPKVYVNGVLQTFEKDYYAVLDDNQNKLTVGLNSIISDDGVRVYISSDDTISPSTRNTMAKMYWGSINSPSKHFYVKNFSGDIFGDTSSSQFYADLKMDNSVNGNGGEIYRFKTSKVSPYATADTSSSNTTVSVTSSTDSVTIGSAWYKIGSSWLKSSADIFATPSYTVIETSSVRVMVKINDRKLKKSSDSCNIQTWMTFYPKGQIFRWDSVYVPNSTVNIDTARFQIVQVYTGSNYGTGYTRTPNTGQKLYGGRYGATSLQDFATALLTLNQSDGVIAPSIFDSVIVYSSTTSPYKGKGIRFTHCSQLSNTKKPYQSAIYFDVQRGNFSGSTFIDSVGKGILYCTGASPTSRLTANGNGSTVLNSVGDFNADGFNEREGAYVYQADNANTAHFTLTANVDTCRFYPAFRITNYTAASGPQYVFVNNIAKVKDFGFNAVVKTATNELIMQLNQIICSNADIFISFDRTLAVTMDNFNASPGDAIVKLHWSTESEENNLGFFLLRRINPAFLDSINRGLDSVAVPQDSTFDFSAGALLKIKKINSSDTDWQQVNTKIISGAMAGVSYGKRNYTLIDQQVYNDVKYEYKLVAVDFNSSRETYDKYASAVPRRILPARFELWTNFPNPFHRLTCLKYDVPVRSKIMLNVYNIQGRLVRQLVHSDKPVRPGFYQVFWDARDDHGRFLASGPYIYRITAQGFAKAKVMIMIK